MVTTSTSVYHLLSPGSASEAGFAVAGNIWIRLFWLEMSFLDRGATVGAANPLDSASKTRRRPGIVYQSKGISSFRDFRRMARRRYPPLTHARPNVMMTDTRTTRPTMEGIPPPANRLPEINLLSFNFSVPLASGRQSAEAPREI